MAGTKNTSNAERDRRICLLRRNGFTFGEIATMEGISRPRVSQIIHEQNAEPEEEAGRAEIASLLEFAERKAVDLVNSPGWKMRPDGRPAEGPDGEAAPDNGIVVEALKILVLVGEKKSRLYGWDKQQLKIRMAEEEAKRQSDASLAALAAAIAADRAAVMEQHRRELEDARRALLPPTVPGEVIAELPPSDGSGGGRRQEDYGG